LSTITGKNLFAEFSQKLILDKIKIDFSILL